MDLMQHRLGLIGGIAKSGARLPREYQEVEYLFTNTGAYIDSGIECTSDLSVKYRYMFFTDTNAAVCGGINTSQSPILFRHHASPTKAGGAYWLQYSSATAASFQVPSAINTRYDIFVDADSGTMTRDGITYQSIFDVPQNMTTGKNYGIFARIASDGSIQWKQSRFYYFEFYRNGDQIGNFIPCYRKSDGEIGMYDLVTQTFFTNAGTGTFLKGADV